MQRIILRSIACLLAACAFSAAVAAPLPSHLFYTGNGYVSAGRTDLISSGSGFAFNVQTFPGSNSLNFSINDFATNPSFQDTQFFLLILAVPVNDRFHVGTYANATRAPFQASNAPGLWFAANGRGDNALTGSFTILDVAFGMDGSLSSLAVDFTQNDENGYLGVSSGSLRFQSLVPIAGVVPEPPFESLLLIGLLALATRRRSIASRTTRVAPGVSAVAG